MGNILALFLQRIEITPSLFVSTKINWLAAGYSFVNWLKCVLFYMKYLNSTKVHLVMIKMSLQSLKMSLEFN